MLDEGNDINLDSTVPVEESGNRRFLIVGGIMAALVFLTLVCMAVYLFVIRPGQSAKSDATKTAVALLNEQDVQQMTLTAEAALWTGTPEPSLTPSRTNTPVPQTPTVSKTPVLVLDTPTIENTSDPAVLAAMQTDLAVQMTSTAAMMAQLGTPQGTRAIGGSGMPTTGFFDEVGLPGLAILTAALLAVIFLARRLRKSPAK
jgi:hypothetical protein